MATSLFARGVLPSRCLEELNVSLPAVVRDVHREFMRGGAEILETNTFGANRVRLASFGLVERVARFNHAAVRIAREAAAGEAFVAGAIGPLGEELAPLGPMTAEKARSIFREQASALVAAGVDLLILETFQSLNELTEAIAAAREVAGPEMVIAAHLAVAEDGSLPDATSLTHAANVLNALEVDVIGINCGAGPRSAYDAFLELAKGTTKFLSAMPAAAQASPQYMAEYARRFDEAGAAIVGGCCMTTADHIFAMKESLRDSPVERREKIEVVDAPDAAAAVPIGTRSELGRALADGEFVWLAETLAPSIDGSPLEVKDLIKAGATAICVRGGSGRVSSLAAAAELQRQKIEAVGIASPASSSFALHRELASAELNGLKNVVAGHAAPLLARMLVVGVERIAGYNEETAFFLSAPIFDAAEAEKLDAQSVPIIATVRILADAWDAEYVREELRIAVPDATLERLREEPGAGVAIAKELCEILKPNVAGILLQGPRKAQLEILRSLAK